MQGFLLAILVLSIIIPIGMSEAFGQITEATVTFVDRYQLPGGSIGQTPRHFDFNSDGTKMFLIGNAADEINQYTLSPGFDISEASFEKRVDITGEVGTDPNGMEFTADGTKVLLNNKKKKVIEFKIDAFDISGVEGQTGTSINFGAHLTKGMRGMTFADDGKKFFVTTSDGINRSADNKVHEFSLSTPYEVSTYTYVDEFDVNEWETDPQDVRFNPDGTRMYVLGPMNDGTIGEFINEFALNCPFQISGECGEEKKVSGGCGFDRDCTAPRITKHGISETPDGFSINNVIFEENQKFYNENPTVEIGIGELTTIKTRAWENMGPEKIFLAIAYLDMQGTKPDWRDSKAYIEYDINEDNITIHDENKMFLAQASTEIVKDPYGDNQGLEFLDITFSLMFTKPMETSHVAIQVVDHIRNYELVYFKDALKVVDRPISEMPEFPGKIEKANTTPKQDEDIHFVLAVNGTEDTIFAAVDGDAIPLEEMNKEEPKVETPEERDARYHLKAKQSEQYERLLEYIAESQAKYPDAWNKIVGSDNVSNQMEHVTDGTKTNVVKNDRRR